MQDGALKNAVRWVTIIALFIIPFLPLFVANSYFFPFITGKNFAFRILVEIALAGWALLMLVDARYRPQFSWTFVLFSAFILWMAIADALAINPAKAFWSNFERMDGWVTLIHVYALFLVTSSVFSVEKLWRKWWLAFLIGATLICIYCFAQLAGVIAIHQSGTRLDASFGNSEYLAAYLLFAMAISLWQAFQAKQLWFKIALGVLTFIEVVLLLESETRGAIIGAAGAVVLGAGLWAFESGKQGRKYAAITLAVMIVLIGGLFLARDSAFVQHIPGVDRVASISLKDSETTARLKIWHMAYEGFLEKPIQGWGQEGFNYVFNQYYDPSLYAQEQWFDRAHDVFLDWLVAGGAPALLLFLALLISSVLALYRSDVSRSERVIFISALAAYCFQGLFVFDNLFSYIPLALIIGMAHASSSRPFPQLEKWQVLTENAFMTMALPVGVIALGLVLWFVNVPNMAAAQDIIGAITPAADITTNLTAFKKAYADGSFADQEITEQLISFTESAIGDPSISDADKTTLVTYALQQTQALVTKIPNDARIRLEYATLLRSIGEYTAALTQIHYAEQLSPTKQTIIQEEGLEQWQMGSTTAAEAAFVKAYNLDTSNTSAASYAAAGSIAAGEIAKGKALLQQVFGTTTVDNNLLIVAYYQQKDFPDLIAILKQQVIDQNNSADAEFQLAEAYADEGDVATARAVIQSAITQHPDAATEGASILSQIPSK